MYTFIIVLLAFLSGCTTPDERPDDFAAGWVRDSGALANSWSAKTSFGPDPMHRAEATFYSQHGKFCVADSSAIDIAMLDDLYAKLHEAGAFKSWSVGEFPAGGRNDSPWIQANGTRTTLSYITARHALRKRTVEGIIPQTGRRSLEADVEAFKQLAWNDDLSHRLAGLPQDQCLPVGSIAELAGN
ncbi:MAG: hypothetical protein AAF752_02290 [Bacteroidota bacterium]